MENRICVALGHGVGKHGRPGVVHWSNRCFPQLTSQSNWDRYCITANLRVINLLLRRVDLISDDSRVAIVDAGRRLESERWTLHEGRL